VIRMPRNHDRQSGFFPAFSWTGLFILTALVLGGATYTGLASDSIMMILALPLIWRLVMTFPQGAPWHVTLMITVIAALFAWQLFPVFSGGGILFPNTLDAGRTLYALLFFLSPLSVFWSALRMDAEEREGLVSWFLAGVGLNFFMAFIQFASANFAAAIQPFAWVMHAGFFANENHLATLFVMAVPAIIAAFRKTPWPLLSLPVILLMVFFEFVVGSRAGVVLILAAAILSFTFVYMRSWIALIVASLVMAAGAWIFWLYLPSDWMREFSVQTDVMSRAAFAKNTLAAIREYWPWGSGFDTFTLVYPGYEKASGIFQAYINHAHDDWLELVLEGGLAAIILLVAFLINILAAAMRGNLSNMQKAAFLAIIFPLLHSLADYPLRTMAISTSLAMFLAMLVAKPEEPLSNLVYGRS